MSKKFIQNWRKRKRDENQTVQQKENKFKRRKLCCGSGKKIEKICWVKGAKRVSIFGREVNNKKQSKKIEKKRPKTRKKKTVKKRTIPVTPVVLRRSNCKKIRILTSEERELENIKKFHIEREIKNKRNKKYYERLLKAKKVKKRGKTTKRGNMPKVIQEKPKKKKMKKIVKRQIVFEEITLEEEKGLHPFKSNFNWEEGIKLIVKNGSEGEQTRRFSRLFRKMDFL